MTAANLLFWVFALVACGGAIAVVISQNVARMAFWLIVSLGSTAGLFFLLHADFVGTAQLLIYVGGTLVLLIFGVMLTASGPFTNIKTSPGEGVLSGVVGSLLLALILSAPYAVKWETLASHHGAGSTVHGASPAEEGNTVRPLGFSLIGLRPDVALKKPADKAHGAESLPKNKGDIQDPVGYLLPFEIVSVHLLVVLVGAAYLARTKRRKDQAPAAG